MSSADDTIKILYARYPPLAIDECAHFPTLHASPSCPYPGLCIEMVNVIAKSLNRRIVATVLPDAEGHINWGIPQTNGSFNGLLGMISSGVVDTVCVFHTVTPFRETYFDFTIPVFKTQSAVAIKGSAGLAQKGLWNLFHVFTPSLWTVMLTTFFLQSIVLVAMNHIEHRIRQRPGVSNASDVFLQVHQLSYGEGGRLRFDTMSGKIALLVFLLFQCLLIPSIYQGMVRAYMLSSPPAAPFDRFADVAKAVAQGRYRIAANNKGDWFLEAIRHSNNPSYVTIRTGKDPIIFTKTIDESMECVNQGQCITSLGLQGYAVYQARRKFCDLTFIWEDMPERELSFVFKTGNPLVELFNKAIFEERVILDSLYRKYYSTFYDQLDSQCHRVETGSSFLPYLGLVVVCSVGIMFAAAALAAEYIVHRKLVVLL